MSLIVAFAIGFVGVVLLPRWPFWVVSLLILSPIAAVGLIFFVSGGWLLVALYAFVYGPPFLVGVVIALILPATLSQNEGS